MLKLQPHADGIILTVRAQPGARRNAVVGIHDGALKVSVTQAAEKGKANQAVVDVLCKTLSLEKSQVVLLSGQTARQKRFLIRNLEANELQRRITAVVAS